MAVGSTTPKMSLLTIGRLSILPMPAAGVSRHRSTTVISEIPRRSRLGPLLSGAAECTPNANHMGRAGVSCQALPTARVPHLATLRVPLEGRGNDSEPLSGKRSKNAARRRMHWGRGIFWTGPLREARLARVSCPGQQGARLLRGGGRSTEPRGSWPLSPPAARPPPLRSFRQGTRACVCERASRSSTDERRAGPARARCGDQEWREHCKRGNLPYGSGRRGGGREDLAYLPIDESRRDVTACQRTPVPPPVVVHTYFRCVSPAQPRELLSSTVRHGAAISDIPLSVCSACVRGCERPTVAGHA